MRDGTFDAFSALLLQIYRASSELPFEAFQDSALNLIKPLLPFDGAMWGTATYLDGVGIDIHTIHLHQQSPDMIVEYEAVKHLDTSAVVVSGAAQVTQGFHSPSWFNGGSRWNDYRDWQRRHGHENVFISAATDQNTGASQWFSLFRADAYQLCREDEVNLLKQLSPHLMQALRHSLGRQLDRATFLPGDSTHDAAISDTRGVVHYATPGWDEVLRAEFGSFGHSSRLPSRLLTWLTSHAEPFVGRSFVVMHRLRKDLLFLRVRPKCAADDLPPRQREVALLMAQGFTHKEVAQQLSRAPATIRNQLQEVYRRLGVQNVAELARVLHDAPG